MEDTVPFLYRINSDPLSIPFVYDLEGILPHKVHDDMYLRGYLAHRFNKRIQHLMEN